MMVGVVICCEICGVLEESFAVFIIKESVLLM